MISPFRILVSAAGIAAIGAATLPLKHAPRATSSSITAEDLMTRLYIIADDSMQGRKAGSAGHVRATDYIARQAKAIGLEPAGEDGTYFQRVPMFMWSVDSTSAISTTTARLIPGRDFILLGNGSVKFANVQTVYGGVVGDSTISSTDASGRLVVYAIRDFKGFGSLRRPPGSETAAGVILAALDSLPDIYRDFIESEAIDLERNEPPVAATGIPGVIMSIAAARHLFASPLESLKVGASGEMVSATYGKSYRPVPFPARNVVAVLRGADPALAHTYVAIGAHSDHLGFSHHPIDHDSIRIYDQVVRPGGAEDAKTRATPEQQQLVNQKLADFRRRSKAQPRLDSIFNGADDDGSGSAALLEIAQYYASLKARPKRSILFVWHVGEEEGMLGSNYFTSHFPVPRESVVAQLNVDMIGRGDATDRTGTNKEGTPLSGSSTYLQLVGSRRLSTELGNIVERVNARQPVPFTFDYSLDATGHPMLIYCRSDHYEYARFGIPVVFFTTGGHADYHQVTDEPQYIDYTHYTRVAKLIADAGLAIANLDHAPVVDHPVPVMGAACVQ